MKSRKVDFAPEAADDLNEIAEWVAEVAGTKVATAYLNRLEEFLLHLDIASERGEARDDVRPGLRVLGFERKLTIAFVVEEERVVILRIHAGGRNREDVL